MYVQRHLTEISQATACGVAVTSVAAADQLSGQQRTGILSDMSCLSHCLCKC